MKNSKAPRRVHGRKSACAFHAMAALLWVPLANSEHSREWPRVSARSAQEGTAQVRVQDVAEMLRGADSEVLLERDGGVTLYSRCTAAVRQHAKKGRAEDAQMLMEIYREVRDMGALGWALATDALGAAAALEGRPQLAEAELQAALAEESVPRVCASVAVLGGWAEKSRHAQMREAIEGAGIDLADTKDQEVVTLSNLLSNYWSAAHLLAQAGEMQPVDKRLAYLAYRGPLVNRLLTDKYRGAVLSAEQYWSPTTWAARRVISETAAEDLGAIRKLLDGEAIEALVRPDILARSQGARAGTPAGDPEKIKKKIAEEVQQVTAAIVDVLHEMERAALER